MKYTKYTLQERFRITFGYQFRMKVLSKSLDSLYDNFLKSLYDLFCGSLGMIGSLIIQPIMIVWNYTFGYFWVTLKLKDNELDQLKQKLEVKD